jgi:Mrp family chromosome partitioning ATPase
MREKLYELEIEESKLRSRYSDGHPLLEQIQQQRKQAEEILKGMPNDRTQTTAALNPNQKQLELDLLQTKAKKEAQQGRLTAAQKQQSELKKQLKELNEAEVQLDDLERNVQLLDGKYRMHVDKLEQARVNDALGRDGISNVKVAQAATLVTKPSAPKKPLILMLGIVLALGGALTVPIIAELFDERLNTAEQVESELGLPVLLALPFKNRAQQSLAKTGRDIDDFVAGDYRTLVNQLLPVSSDTSSKAVGVVGCDISPLRSDVAAELAIQAANCGNAPVLLIDADERHRNVAERFGLNGSPGWHEVLAGAADPQSCVHSADNGRLAVMTSGRSTARSEDAGLVSGSTQLGELKQMYGLVVVDVPSVAVFNTRASADWLDESLLVIEAGRTRTETARRARILIERSGIRVAGVVLASQCEYIPRWLNDRL